MSSKKTTKKSAAKKSTDSAKSAGVSGAKATEKSAAKKPPGSAKSAGVSGAKATEKSARRTAAKVGSRGFTAEERAAMKERANELKSEAGGGGKKRKADGESDILAKIAEMNGSDRAMAERLHALIGAAAPELSPKTWYGMPAYAKAGKVVCFFQSAQKFKSRYATLGFSDEARLDDGAMWPTSFALKDLTAAEEAKIRALVKKAVG